MQELRCLHFFHYSNDRDLHPPSLHKITVKPSTQLPPASPISVARLPSSRVDCMVLSTDEDIQFISRSTNAFNDRSGQRLHVANRPPSLPFPGTGFPCCCPNMAIKPDHEDVELVSGTRNSSHRRAWPGTSVCNRPPTMPTPKTGLPRCGVDDPIFACNEDIEFVC